MQLFRLYLQSTSFEIGGDETLILDTPTTPLLVSRLLVNAVLCLQLSDGENCL